MNIYLNILGEREEKESYTDYLAIWGERERRDMSFHSF